MAEECGLCYWMQWSFNFLRHNGQNIAVPVNSGVEISLILVDTRVRSS